jgi:hypothetical protein
MGSNCWSVGGSVVGRSVGWSVCLWQYEVYVSNKDDYRSLLCICACYARDDFFTYF